MKIKVHELRSKSKSDLMKQLDEMKSELGRFFSLLKSSAEGNAVAAKKVIKIVR